MKKINAFVGQVPEKFSEKRRLPKTPLVVIAILAGTVGTYALIRSFAATPSCDQTVSSVTAAQTAVSSAAGGTTVCMAAGSYGSISLSGTHSSNVTFQADPSGDVNGAGKVTFSGINVSGTYITVRNFYTTRGLNFVKPAAHDVADHNDVTNGPGGYGISIECNGGTQPGCSYITVNGNRIHDLAPTADDADGLRFDGWSNVTVTNNEEYHVEQTSVGSNIGHTDCLQSYNANVDTHDIVFDHNYLHDNQCQGFFLKDGDVSHNVTVTDNLFVRGTNLNGADTNIFLTENTDNAVIRNNTSVNTGGSVIQASGSGAAAATVDHNIFDVFNNIPTKYSLTENYNIFTDNNQWSFNVNSTDIPQGGGKYTPSYKCGSSCGNGTKAGDDYRLASNPNGIGIDWSPVDQIYGPVNSGSTTPPPPPPADTTPPTVALNAPANGSTVSGASTVVSATASDDTGVSGVQFKLDGNNLGSEDATSPYEMSWDTTKVSNGSHSLTAVARDAAGNTKTSSAVTVTVNNSTAGGGGGSTGCTTTVSSVSAAQTAVSSASPGQTVCLADGTYGKLTLNATKAAPGVTVQAQNPGQASIAGASMAGTNITLAQFHMLGEVDIAAGTTGMTVSHNFFDLNNYTGFGVVACNSSTTSCSDMAITNNRFVGLPEEDIVRANRYHDANGDGVGLLVQDNEFVGNQEHNDHNDNFQSVWSGDHLVFKRNYIHDFGGQGFFVKDQEATIDGVVASDNLITNQNLPCIPASECAGFQLSPFQVFGPITNVSMTHNTVGFASDGTADGGMAVLTGAWSNATFSDNAFSALSINSDGGSGTAMSGSNNTYCTKQSGATVPAGSSVSCNPAFIDPAHGDFRQSNGRGVDWKVGDIVYGPGTSTAAPPPSDTASPTVSFSSPASGATVSGLVTAAAAATDNVGVTKVEISLDGSLKMTDTASPYNYSFDSKTLSNGTHTLSAKAYDAAGNIGTATVTVTVSNPDTTPPNAPANLTANATNATTVNLSWSAATDTGSNPSGVVKYNVLRNGVVIAQPTTTSYSDTGRTSNTSYSYVVQAVDAAGNVSANSNTATASTPAAPDTTAPSVPANLTATAVSRRQINLSWDASTDSGGSGLAGYNIYRNGTKINSSLVTTASYGDSTVSSNTTYSYKIEAVDGAGNKSAQTNSVSATTPRNKRGDVTGSAGAPDGTIDLQDVSYVIRNYNTSDPNADISGPDGTPDGKVDLFDLSYIIRNYGQ